LSLVVKIAYKTLPRVDKFTGNPIQCVNPATQHKLGVEHSATKKEVEECVKRAQIAQRVWAKTSFEERRAVLRDFIETVLCNQEDICVASMNDTGKTMFEAQAGEILTTLEKARWTIANGEKYLWPSKRSPPLLLMYKKAQVEYHPIGVIGAIVPWNYPFHNCSSPTISAIFSGNAIIVKFSEWSSWSRAYYETIWQTVLKRRGHNPDLIQFIPGYGDTGAALVESKGIGKILFIGSPPIGKKVMENAAKNLTPVILELGGKDPFIVCEDANLSLARDLALRGALINCGQNCLSAERIFVHRQIHDKFVGMLKERIALMSQGWDLATDPPEYHSLGSITTPPQLEKIDAIVKDAIQKGAIVVHGGKRITTKQGLFYEPTIIVNLKSNMRLVQEEIFGPIVPIFPFETEDELIELCNQSEYALGCTIISRSIKRAERIARRIVSGMCVINDFGTQYLIQDCPFGGCKASGFGRFNGPEGLRGFCHEKTIVSDLITLPSSWVSPRFVNYPILQTTPWLFQNTVILIYAGSLRAKIRALMSLLTSSFRKRK